MRAGAAQVRRAMLEFDAHRDEMYREYAECIWRYATRNMENIRQWEARIEALLQAPMRADHAAALREWRTRLYGAAYAQALERQERGEDSTAAAAAAAAAAAGDMQHTEGQGEEESGKERRMDTVAGKESVGQHAAVRDGPIDSTRVGEDLPMEHVLAAAAAIAEMDAAAAAAATTTASGVMRGDGGQQGGAGLSSDDALPSVAVEGAGEEQEAAVAMPRTIAGAGARRMPPLHSAASQLTAADAASMLPRTLVSAAAGTSAGPARGAVFDGSANAGKATAATAGGGGGGAAAAAALHPEAVVAGGGTRSLAVDADTASLASHDDTHGDGGAMWEEPVNDWAGPQDDERDHERDDSTSPRKQQQQQQQQQQGPSSVDGMQGGGGRRGLSSSGDVCRTFDGEPTGASGCGAEKQAHTHPYGTVHEYREDLQRRAALLAD